MTEELKKEIRSQRAALENILMREEDVYAHNAAEALVIDWETETNNPLAEMDAIYAEYSKSFGKPYPDKEMAMIVDKTKEMLFRWWGCHRETIRAALQSQPPEDGSEC